MEDPRTTIESGKTAAEKAAVTVVETLWHHQTAKEWREVSLAEAAKKRLVNGHQLRFELDVSQPGIALTCAQGSEGCLSRALRPDGTSILVSLRIDGDKLNWADLAVGGEPVQASGWYQGRRGLVLVEWKSGRSRIVAWASDWAGVAVYRAHEAASEAAQLAAV
jgi:hypothetical protein